MYLQGSYSWKAAGSGVYRDCWKMLPASSHQPGRDAEFYRWKGTGRESLVLDSHDACGWASECGEWCWQVAFAVWSICRGTEVSVTLHVGYIFPF